MYDFTRRDCIARAITAAMKKRDEEANDPTCIFCGDTRVSFPSRIIVTCDAFENYTAFLETLSPVPMDGEWIPLAKVNHGDASERYLACPTCADSKGIYKKPEPSPVAVPTAAELNPEITKTPAELGLKPQKEDEIPF